MEFSEEQNRLIEAARNVFKLEIQALQKAGDRIGAEFIRAVDEINSCAGKVIVTGLGKSGIAGQKIAATLSATGKPSFFLHAGEAGHGDSGVIASGDVVIALSYSGETKELLEIIPRLKLLRVPVISLTGGLESQLAMASDIVLNAEVPKNPWPFGILPTASNAVTVAMGEALAIALLEISGFKAEDFASFHPSGLLGKKMLVKLEDLMHTGEAIPRVSSDTVMKDVLVEMTGKRLGVACVVDEGGKLLGIITDGDLRRLLERSADPLSLKAGEVMTVDPKTADPEALAAGVLSDMERDGITAMPVTGEGNALMGIVHIHDIIKLETR